MLNFASKYIHSSYFGSLQTSRKFFHVQSALERNNQHRALEGFLWYPHILPLVLPWSCCESRCSSGHGGGLRTEFQAFISVPSLLYPCLCALISVSTPVLFIPGPERSFDLHTLVLPCGPFQPFHTPHPSHLPPCLCRSLHRAQKALFISPPISGHTETSHF